MGNMKPEEVQRIIAELYPKRGQIALAEDIGTSSVVVNRWCKGRSAVSGPVTLLLRLLLELHKKGIDWKKLTKKTT